MIKRLIVPLLIISQSTLAKPCITQRELFIDNKTTKVWKTTICPNQVLPFHSHQHARVVIPAEDGHLKVRYKSGKEKIIVLKKQVPTFLSVAQGKELHQDEALGKKALHVTVIELK